MRSAAFRGRLIENKVQKRREHDLSSVYRDIPKKFDSFKFVMDDDTGKRIQSLRFRRPIAGH